MTYTKNSVGFLSLTYWLDLQREADINEASKDKELQDILKAIPKTKKYKYYPS